DYPRIISYNPPPK
ncbi:Cytoplasmic protein, partial [Monkeypox virus]